MWGWWLRWISKLWKWEEVCNFKEGQHLERIEERLAKLIEWRMSLRARIQMAHKWIWMSDDLCKCCWSTSHTCKKPSLPCLQLMETVFSPSFSLMKSEKKALRKSIQQSKVLPCGRKGMVGGRRNRNSVWSLTCCSMSLSLSLLSYKVFLVGCTDCYNVQTACSSQLRTIRGLLEWKYPMIRLSYEGFSMYPDDSKAILKNGWSYPNSSI